MLELDGVRLMFGIATACACLLAIRAAVRRDPRLGWHLATTGIYAVIFFTTFRGVRWQVIAIAVLAVFCGWLLQPGKRNSVEIGEDSTVRRR